VVAYAEPDQALLGAPIPVQAESQGRAGGCEREAHRQAARPGLERDRVQRPLRGRAQLVGNHALGELDEAVIGLSVCDPGATGT
jgi:hypothetical protein